jgi:hypothetical protein
VAGRVCPKDANIESRTTGCVLAVPEDHIQLWKTSLEFDNFSDTEIASAMTTLAGSRASFKQTDIKQARQGKNPGKALSELYKARTNYSLNKPYLATHLMALLIDPKARRNPANRPLVKILSRVKRLAERNPFPQRQETWIINQASSFLGGN